MEIRIAREDDLLAINEIYNQAVLQQFCTAHLEQVSMEERKLWFRAHDPAVYPVFVAVADLCPYQPRNHAGSSARQERC